MILKKEATALAKNKLLPTILEQRRNEMLEKWKMCPDPAQREQIWHGQNQLEELAGAIDNAIRAAKRSGS